MPKIALILVAAGQASRFAPKRSSPFLGPLSKKPFVPLAGRAVFLHSIDLFSKIPDVRQMILVVAPDDIAAVEEKFAGPLSLYGVELVAGGARRCDSVENGLAAVRDEIDYVAVHDAARPCVSRRLAEAVFRAAEETGAAIPAARLVGTIKRAVEKAADSPGETEPLAAMFGTKTKGGGESAREILIAETVPRDDLWEAQTPQVFRRDLYERAVRERGTFAPTDDASLFERLNIPVKIVPSDWTNLKITVADDSALAEKLLGVKNR